MTTYLGLYQEIRKLTSIFQKNLYTNVLKDFTVLIEELFVPDQYSSFSSLFFPLFF